MIITQISLFFLYAITQHIFVQIKTPVKDPTNQMNLSLIMAYMQSVIIIPFPVECRIILTGTKCQMTGTKCLVPVILTGSLSKIKFRLEHIAL